LAIHAPHVFNGSLIRADRYWGHHGCFFFLAGTSNGEVNERAMENLK